MADTTLGRFVFDFISNTDSLKKGNEEAAASSEALALQISRISISNDNLATRMVSVVNAMSHYAQASENLAAKQARASESNEDLTVAITTLTEDIKALTDAQAAQREEADKSNKENEKGSRTFERYGKRLLGLLAAYASINKAKSSLKGGFERNLELAKFTELLDLNAASVRNWQNVLVGIGGAGSDITETFKNISIQLGEIDVAGTGAPLLQAVNRLGIKIRDEFGKNLSPDEILLNFADALQSKNLDKELSLYVAGQFGISDDVLRLLNRGRAEIEGLLKEQREEQYQITPEDTEGLLRLQKQIADVQQQASSLFTEIGLDNLELAISYLENVETLIKSIRGQSFKEDYIDSFPGVVGVIMEDIQGFLKEQSDKSLERSNLRQLEAEELQLRENAQKFLQQESAGQKVNSFNAGVGGGSTFDFRNLTIQSGSGSGSEIASDFVAEVRRALNGEFTSASEVLGNSVIA